MLVIPLIGGVWRDGKDPDPAPDGAFLHAIQTPRRALPLSRRRQESVRKTRQPPKNPTKLVRERGLEPPPLAGPDPKSGVSAISPLARPRRFPPGNFTSTPRSTAISEPAATDAILTVQHATGASRRFHGRCWDWRVSRSPLDRTNPERCSCRSAAVSAAHSFKPAPCDRRAAFHAAWSTATKLRRVSSEIGWSTKR